MIGIDMFTCRWSSEAPQSLPFLMYKPLLSKPGISVDFLGDGFFLGSFHSVGQYCGRENIGTPA